MIRLIPLVLVLAACARTAPVQTVDPAARDGAVFHDVTYCAPDGVELKMDLYYPQATAYPAPVVVYIHGGGWVGGDKSQTGELGAGLLAHNFVLVSLNYRLAPEYPHPAQIQDVKCALRHLRANAERYGIDPERIGASGSSAGAHLASMLGLTDETAGWDTGEYAGQSSRADAVAALFPPTDLSREFPGIQASIQAGIFGTLTPSESLLLQASPITHVSPDDSPFLLIHGELDRYVPPDQSQILYDRLAAAGVPAELILVKDARHAFLADNNPVEPDREAVILRIAEFFAQSMR